MTAIRTAFLIASVFGGVVPAEAQGVFDMGVLTNTVSIPTRAAPGRATSQIGTPVPTRRDYTAAETAIGVVPGAFDRPASAGASDVRLDYRPTPALRRRAVEGYISRIQREYPEAAKVMEAQLTQHDYTKIYSGLMRGAGLRDNDAADAVVAYTLLGWQIANRSTAKISNDQVAAVRRQIAPAIAANPRLSSPASRADLGEEMKLLFVTLHAGWQSAEKEGNTKQYSDGIARMWQRQSGRDLRNVVLTREGFSRRS